MKNYSLMLFWRISFLFSSAVCLSQSATAFEYRELHHAALTSSTAEAVAYNPALGQFVFVGRAGQGPITLPTRWTQNGVSTSLPTGLLGDGQALGITYWSETGQEIISGGTLGATQRALAWVDHQLSVLDSTEPGSANRCFENVVNGYLTLGGTDQRPVRWTFDGTSFKRTDFGPADILYGFTQDSYLNSALGIDLTVGEIGEAAVQNQLGIWDKPANFSRLPQLPDASSDEVKAIHTDAYESFLQVAGISVDEEFNSQATLWQNASGEWERIILTPVGAESSQALDTALGIQVGAAKAPGAGQVFRAGYWLGSAETWTPVSDLLPKAYQDWSSYLTSVSALFDTELGDYTKIAFSGYVQRDQFPQVVRAFALIYSID